GAGGDVEGVSARAARGAAGGAQRVDLARGKIEARTRAGVEEIRRLVTLVRVEGGSNERTRCVRRHQPEFYDGRVLGDERARGELLGGRSRGGGQDQSNSRRHLALAVLHDGKGHHLAAREAAPLLQRDLEVLLHLAGGRGLRRRRGWSAAEDGE